MLRTALRTTVRHFSATPLRRGVQEIAREPIDTPLSLWNWTEEEQMLRETVRRFANDVIAPRVREMDEKEEMDPAIVKGLFENGLMGIETPAELGGSEMSFTGAIIAVEELARVDPSVAVLADVHNTLVNSVLRLYGNDHVKERWLPGLATEKVGSFCLSEPAAGSDAFALQTTAKKDGDHYILNGSKAWISNSAEADTFLVFANVDPSKGYKGITCFGMDKADGVEIAKREKKLGIRSSSTCVLSFDDVRLPKENIIGEIGKGYKYAIEILNEGRIGIAAQMIGLAQGAFDHAVTYAYQRKQFGKFIGDNQAMGHQFAEIATKIEAARLLTYNAARLKEEGRPFTQEAAMAKYYASNVAQEAAGQAIEWCGGVGFTRDLPVEKLCLGVPGGPKLMGFDVANNATTPFTTITFTEDVLPPLGYLNDLRIDLTASLTNSGEGIVYLADSGAAAIIVVDLGTGKSWRHLSGLHSTSPNPTQLPTFFGVPTYLASPKNPAFHYETVAGGGIDGFTISADGQFIYYTPFASRDLYRVPTAALLLNPADDNLAFSKCADSVQHLGQIGGQADGLETDTTGKIYVSSPEHNSINIFDPETGMISPFVRSPIMAWPDTLTVANDGFIYATLNQLWLSPGFQNGTDKRVKPFALVRVPIEGKPVLLG